MPNTPSTLDAALTEPHDAVLTRRATAADAAVLQDFYESLDGESRYRRFLQPMPRVPAALAPRVLSAADVVLVAEDLRGRIVAEAVLAGLGRAPEVAYAVSPPYRRAGLASRLVRELATMTEQAGERTLRATIGGDNHPSISLMRALGATVRFDDGEMIATLELAGLDSRLHSVPTVETNGSRDPDRA